MKTTNPLRKLTNDELIYVHNDVCAAMLPPDSDGSTYAPDSWQAWESAVSATFGGVVRSWPHWAQDAYKRHYGYLP